MEISIHASRGGSDIADTELLPHRLEFQSTLPAGEATEPRGVGVPEGAISIHASRGGSDHPVSAYWLKFANFNPRFPRGKRRMKKKY